MAFEIDSILQSQKIFYHLLKNGQLEESEAPELYKAYVEQEEVMALVKSQGEVADSVVERYGNVIYLMPEVSNTMLGFSKAELKKILCKSTGTDRDYYLSQFLILTLLAEFYDGQGSHCKSRDFIRMGELQNILSERLKTGRMLEEEREQNEAGEDDRKSPKKETMLDYQSMSMAYEALKSEDKKRSRARTTKEGFLYTVMDFLEEQNLVIYIQEDEIIKTTDKLDHLMEMKLLNRANYKKMMRALGVEDNE